MSFIVKGAIMEEKQVKYYVEFADIDSPCEYIMQSKFFNTEEQALEWAKGVTYIDKHYSIRLMSSEWDFENDTYKDIEFVRYLNKELNIRGNKMRLVSLFSGVGAFEKALTNLNIDHEVINYCEFDKFASESYSAIHGISKSLNLGDITKVKIAELQQGCADLITYGFPCQDISNAGKQKGFEDENGNLTRSGLFFYASAIIGRIQPKIAICENVKALTSKKFENEFKTVLDTLEQLGYNNYWQVLNAKDYGIPQNRERVFVVSVRKDIDNGEFNFPKPFNLEKKLADMLDTEVDEKYYLSDRMIKYISANNEKWTGNNNKSLINKTIASTLTTSEGHYRCDTSNYISSDFPENFDLKTVKPIKCEICVPNATKQGYQVAEQGDSINLSFPNSKTRRGRVGKGVAQTLDCQCNQGTLATDLRIRKLTPKECWRLMGFDDKDIEKAQAVGISNAQLYKQAGNSIVVNVLMELFKSLKQANLI